MTHSHALDEALAERILRRNDCAWFGLIGSLTNGASSSGGWNAAAIRRRASLMSCPIGVRNSRQGPAVIAVAVAAELLQVRARAVAGVDPSANVRRA
jgi:xanthine/CO dehydrogenase XdhC/CoxF family maturation factor